MAAVRFLLLSISVVLFVSLTVVTEASYSMSRSGRSRNVDWSNTDSLARTLDMTNRYVRIVYATIKTYGYMFIFQREIFSPAWQKER